MYFPRFKPPVRRRLSRRALLVGGVTIGSTLAVAGWKLIKFPVFPSYPRYIHFPVDKHRVLCAPSMSENISYTWLPDSRHLMYVTAEGIFLVDRQSGQSIRKSAGGRFAWWSSNGERMVYMNGNGNVVVEDTLNGQIIGPQPDFSLSLLRSFAISPDGTRLASVLPTESVEVWDLQKESPPLEYDPQWKQGIILDLAWSPDSKKLALINEKASTQVWNGVHNKLLWTSQAQDSSLGNQLAWSPDGASIACVERSLSSPSRLCVLDAHTGKLRFQMDALSGNISWSPDGTHIAFFAQEQQTRVIQVWDVRTACYLFTCRYPQPVQSVALSSWSPNGQYLAAWTVTHGNIDQSSTIQFWDAQHGQALSSYQVTHPDQMQWSPDSSFLAVVAPLEFYCDAAHCRYQQYALQVFQIS